MDHPELRTGFRHADLYNWTRTNRGALVHAALVLIQAWIAAERPDGKIVLGKFEAQCHVIGGILKVAGIEGYLENHLRLQQDADGESQTLEQLVTIWWDKFESRPVTASDILNIVERNEIPILGWGDNRDLAKRVGWFLKRVLGRVVGVYDGVEKIGEYRIMRCSERINGGRSTGYYLMRLEGGNSFAF
jgi:hypothetical protein